MILAITGATGFVGGHLLTRALAAGHEVRALARRPQPGRAGVTWVAGDLAHPGALCDGADAVVHVAGVVNAPTRAAFDAGNVAGTAAVLAAARAAGVRRFVHVSSLAAREPALSDYGASKAGAEALIAAASLDTTIVRPPAVYGPGDTEMRELFVAARVGVVPLPPDGRASLIHVDDLARALLALAEAPACPGTFEVADPSGPLSHRELARALGRAVGRRALPLPLPAALLRLAARLDRLARGDAAKLTPDRVAYMVHPDWTADPARALPPAIWSPAIARDDGLAATANWYRAHGLL